MIKSTYVWGLLLVAALLAGCTSDAISQDAAIAAVEQRAAMLNVPIHERTATVTETEDGFVLTYPPKANDRSGGWTFTVDRITGSVTDENIER